MIKFMTFCASASMVVLISLPFLIMLRTVFLRRRALRTFWDRACMGIRWRRRFPHSPKADIREFLSLLVDAFGFSQSRRCCFSPDDRLMDIYRAVFPPGSYMDNMELESLGLRLEERYGIDLFADERYDITLGEIYEQTRRAA